MRALYLGSLFIFSSLFFAPHSQAKSLRDSVAIANLFYNLEVFAAAGANLEAAGFAEDDFTLDETYGQCRFEYQEGITAEFVAYVTEIEREGNMETAAQSYPYIRGKAIDEFYDLMGPGPYTVCTREVLKEYSRTKETLIIGNDGYKLLLWTGWEN